MERTATCFNRFSVIVERRYVLMHFNAEKDLSQEAEVTTIVGSILTTFVKAILSLESSSRAAPIELKVLLSFSEANFNVFLACMHSILRTSLSIWRWYCFIIGNNSAGSRKDSE